MKQIFDFREADVSKYKRKLQENPATWVVTESLVLLEVTCRVFIKVKPASNWY